MVVEKKKFAEKVKKRDATKKRDERQKIKEKEEKRKEVVKKAEKKFEAELEVEESKEDDVEVLDEFKFDMFSLENLLMLDNLTVLRKKKNDNEDHVDDDFDKLPVVKVPAVDSLTMNSSNQEVSLSHDISNVVLREGHAELGVRLLSPDKELPDP